MDEYTYWPPCPQCDREQNAPLVGEQVCTTCKAHNGYTATITDLSVKLGEALGKLTEARAELAALRARAVPEGPEGWEVTEAHREVGEAWEATNLYRSARDLDGYVLWFGTKWRWQVVRGFAILVEGTAPTLEAACAAADAAMGVERG